MNEINEIIENDFEDADKGESVLLDTIIQLEKKEIVAGLEATFRKSGRTFNIAKTVILVIAFFLFLGSSIYEKQLLSINSFIALVILIIIFILWFLPSYRFGKVAEEMILSGKNKLHMKIRGDLFIFGEENTVSINIKEELPLISSNNLIFNNGGNIFIVPSRSLGDELWDKYASF